MAQWAAEPILAADTSVASVVMSLAVAGSGAATMAALPSVAAAFSAQALASLQRVRIGGMTIGVTVACHGGSGRHPVGANAYANPLEVRPLHFVWALVEEGVSRRRVRDGHCHKPHGAVVKKAKLVSDAGDGA